MKIRELQRKRHQLTERAATIMQRAEGREMTDAERREFDQLMDERDRVDQDIKRAERLQEDERRACEDDARGVRGGRGEGSGLWFTTADGRTVRGVLHGERFADATGEHADDGLSLARAMTAIITGERDIAEAEFRAQAVAQDPAGGFFVSPELSSTFIDQARARSVLSEAGAITIPLGSGETRIIKVTADPTAAWKAELAALNNTGVTFGSIQMYPKVLGCVLDISEELVQDGRNAPEVIEGVLAQAIADQLDRSLFRGIDGGVDGRYFTGILDDPDVNTVDMAGSAPTAETAFDEVIDAIEKVETANGAPDVHVLSPRTWGQYSKLKDTTHQPIQMPATVAALRHLRTTQVPTDLGDTANESASVVGNFTSAFVMLGVRSKFRVEVSPHAGNAFENLGRKVRVWGRYDMAIGRPSHLAVIQAIGPTS